MSSEIVRVPAGGVLFEEGSLGDCMYVVVEGLVEVRRRRGDEQVLLGTFGPGEMFGEHALLRGLARTATAVAAEPSLLERLDRDALTAKLRGDILFAVRLLEHLANMNMRIAEHLLDLAHDEEEARERLAGVEYERPAEHG